MLSYTLWHKTAGVGINQPIATGFLVKTLRDRRLRQRSFRAMKDEPRERDLRRVGGQQTVDTENINTLMGCQDQIGADAARVAEIFNSFWIGSFPFCLVCHFRNVADDLAYAVPVACQEILGVRRIGARERSDGRHADHAIKQGAKEA